MISFIILAIYNNKNNVYWNVTDIKILNTTKFKNIIIKVSVFLNIVLI